MLTAPDLDGIPHGFSTREELSLGRVLAGAPLVTARQVHSAEVLTVREPWDGPLPEADALVTDRRGLLIGVVTADCAPVLLADREAGVVGAAHAGWRGAIGGVLENAVAAMELLGAGRDRIVAAVGPTIAQASYEVDATFYEQLVDHDPANIDLLTRGSPGRFQFDLPGYVIRRLLFGAGVRTVHNLEEDTYTQADRFFSFRRATHRGEPTGGRQISVIGISE